MAGAILLASTITLFATKNLDKANKNSRNWEEQAVHEANYMLNVKAKK